MTTNGNYRKCAATRRDGEPCQGNALPDSDYCFAHDPELAEKRHAARSQGGKNRANVVRLRGLMPPRLMPIFDRLERAMEEVHDGVLDPKRATALASLARAACTVLQVGEMEERLRNVEDAVNESERRTWAS